MTLCSCNSGQNFEDCCHPLLDGTPAPTAEALMRSRYTAFVRRDVDYLERTNAPEIRAAFNRADAERAVRESEWKDLEVLAVTGGGPEDETGDVEFQALCRRRGEWVRYHELGSFRRDDGQWFYVKGKLDPKTSGRRPAMAGRNEPCPCGSGKKYKKCCGA
ncbi:MAG TPA: YchJ family metal-binding protein [Azospirillaceae bacterium]|nr:YchJ family metal-binding protein [Azospirillaceae bacterium]